MAYSSRMGAIFNYTNYLVGDIMLKTLIACALLCASSAALADVYEYKCGQGDEAIINMGDDSSKSFITVNGIQYDYANTFVPRAHPEGIMYQFSHNNFSVFLSINTVDSTVEINYEGRSELCTTGDVYEQ